MYTLILATLLAGQLPMDRVIHENPRLGMEALMETSNKVAQPIYSCTDKFGRSWSSYSQKELNNILIRENAKYFYGTDKLGRKWKNLYKWRLERDIKEINKEIDETYYNWEYGASPQYYTPQPQTFMPASSYNMLGSMGGMSFGGGMMGGGVCAGGG